MAVTNPIARTAFYCCVIRADDASSAAPVCGDTLAARFFDDAIRRDVEPLLRFKEPAASNVARHRLIDDLVREHIRRDPNARIILLGAGFDTRAFRLEGGRYVEIDDPNLFAYKEDRLPAATAPNPLTRIPVTFAETRPDVFLAPLAGDDRALVVLEGVSMYLRPEAIAELVAALVRALPRATLVCDLMSVRFVRAGNRRLKHALAALGVAFHEPAEHPSHVITAAGYRPIARYSIIERARQAGSLRVPRLLLATVFRWVRDGYQVWVFEPRPA